MSLRFACFVTGTDTGVGKTVISAALVHALGQQGLLAAGMKPVAAGATEVNGLRENEDVTLLAQASAPGVPRALIAPCVLLEPAAPHVAAALEHTVIDPAQLLAAYAALAAQTEAVVVEGVGGFRVPLTPSFDTADLAARLGLDVILVVGLRLGCLNHALLTAEAIAARGLRLAGWVANEIDPAMPHQQGNLQALQERLVAPCLGVVPWMAQPSAAAAAAHLELSRLAGWPAPKA